MELPNKFGFAFELAPAAPKLKRGGGAEVSVPRPANRFFAGDVSSCFMGLPPNKLAVENEAGGDFGAAPNRDLAACWEVSVGLGPALAADPKENRDAAAGWLAAGGEGSFLAGTALGAPNKPVGAAAGAAVPNKLVDEDKAGFGLAGSEVKAGVLAPNRDVDVDVGAGAAAAAPNKLVEVTGVVVAGGAAGAVPNRLLVVGAGEGADRGVEDGAAAGVAGLMPKRAADAPVNGFAFAASELPKSPLLLGFSDSFLGANRAAVDAEGIDVWTSPNSFEAASEFPMAPNKLVVAVVAAGLAGSLTLTGSAAAGLRPKSGAPVLGTADTLGSEKTFLVG